MKPQIKPTLFTKKINLQLESENYPNIINIQNKLLSIVKQLTKHQDDMRTVKSKYVRINFNTEQNETN